MPYAIVDDQGRIIIMLCGRPRGGDWDSVVKEMTRVMLRGGGQANVGPTGLSHRRGRYSALSLGVSYGGGQTVGTVYHDIAL